jgi:copper chaperone CopZ
VIEHEVEYRHDTARVVFDPSIVTIQEIEDALGQVGYRPAIHYDVDD